MSFFAKYFFKYNPNFNCGLSLKMSEKKMFFSSDKAKKKLHYRPRPCKKCYKRLNKLDEKILYSG